MRSPIACSLNVHCIIFLSLTIFLSFTSSAQTDPISVKKDDSKMPLSFSMQGYYYLISFEKGAAITNNYIFQACADRRSLHVEVRYNYEDQNTGSAFAGWNFKTGNKVQLNITPMVGAVAGNTNGIAPAFEFDLSYEFLDFYDKSEYVIDFAGKENNFFYTWWEIAATPFKNFRGGFSGQRTKLYETESNIQRGFFAEYKIWKITAGAYYFNPFRDNPFVLTSLSVDF
jgi:hypothetical protein